MSRRRIFIALELGKHICGRVLSLQETLARTETSIKCVGEGNVHLTLLFLGEIDDQDLVAVCRIVKEQAAQHGPFQISVEGMGCFPTPRRPRIVWVGIGEGAEEVSALHDALQEPLLELGCYRREDRKYTPHVTVGRVKAKESTDKLAELVAKKADWKAGEVAIREVIVFSSELTPRGPIYAAVSRSRLGSANG